MDFNKIDFTKYEIRFNQKKYNQLSVFKNKELKHVLTFHFIGLIDLNKELFYWANIIPGVNKNFVIKNNKIKSLSSNYEDFSINNNELFFQILNENTIKINNKINPEFIKNFFYNLLDKPIILLNSSNNLYQLISIENINESY